MTVRTGNFPFRCYRCHCSVIILNIMMFLILNSFLILSTYKMSYVKMNLLIISSAQNRPLLDVSLSQTHYTFCTMIGRMWPTHTTLTKRVSIAILFRVVLVLTVMLKKDVTLLWTTVKNLSSLATYIRDFRCIIIGFLISIMDFTVSFLIIIK